MDVVEHSNSTPARWSTSWSTRLSMHEAHHHFKDVIELNDNNWVGYDCVTKEEMQVPFADMMFAGFECDTVTPTNNSVSSADKRHCVEYSFGKTGTTGDISS